MNSGAVLVRGLWRLDDGREIERAVIVPIADVRAVGPITEEAYPAIAEMAIHALRHERHSFPEGDAMLVDVRETMVRFPPVQEGWSLA